MSHAEVVAALRRTAVTRKTLLVLLAGVTACALPPAATTTPEAPAPDPHLSALEQRHLAQIQRIHEPGLGLVRRFRESGLLADSAEWWVAGDRDVLPFAGSWRGLAGIAEFESRLGAAMRYDKVELREYLVSGNQVAAIFLGEGVARATGIPFRGEIVRIYTFAAGKVVRVRNYYDTGAYVRAVLGGDRTSGVRPSPDGPDGAARIVADADSLAAGRRFQEAAARYADALALWPDSLGIARRALGSFWRAARYDDAYVWGQKLLAREPRSLGVLFNLGVTCGFLVELPCLEEMFRRSLEIDSTFVDGYGELAFLEQARGDLAAAIRLMEMARAVAPASEFAVSGLAQMLIPAGEAARARAVMEPRLAANRQARAYGGRSMLTLHGWALLRDGDTAAANAAFDEVLTRLAERERSGQTTYQLYRERAAIHALRGEHEAAIAAMRAAYDRGWRLYGAWSLVDPMFESVVRDPRAVVMLDSMRADVTGMRRRIGLGK